MRTAPHLLRRPSPARQRQVGPDTTRQWWEAALRLGDESALDALRGARDILYLPAAEDGAASAMNSLGAVLIGVDDGAALWWFEKAAHAGSTNAMSNLATVLAKTDPDRAEYWRSQATALSSEAE